MDSNPAPKDQVEPLPYRPCVGCIVVQEDWFLLVQLVGWPAHFWKFPQGGVEPGETLVEAGLRELREELGSTAFRVLEISRVTHGYAWPADSVHKAGCWWGGQRQRFLLVEYLGNGDDLCGNPGEIQRWTWVDRSSLARHIDHDHPLWAGYKNAVEKVLAEFKLMD
jgi:putative (di)nucleoside polyphosphate hydrolase